MHILITALITLLPTATPSLEQLPGQAPVGSIEIHGVAAGAFNAGWWEANTLHFVADGRHPLLAPRESGGYRNIYAPSAVEVEGGWRLFYGAWDGVATGNDRIYSTTTEDFIDFGPRQTEIEHGVFIHACNVNALYTPRGAWEMVCTVYPDKADRNKPAYFQSADGQRWNAGPVPYAADYANIVSIAGYEGYPEADINGMNVLLREGEKLHLYFNNFKDFGQVYRATATAPPNFTFEGVALKAPHAVNDVKRFETAEGPCYLMGLHMNTGQLWYALASDGLHFGEEKPLVAALGAADRYMVALGWVRQGERLLGVLYGAGAVPGLNRNRIFARWLQKRVVFVDASGQRFEATSALGPDRQRIELPDEAPRTGVLECYAADGETRIGAPTPVKITPGAIYRLRF